MKSKVRTIPYIKGKRKRALMGDSSPRDVGELTYVICKACDDYLRVKGKDEGLRYQYLAEVAGALANSQNEIYRRVTVELEDVKKGQNGEVFFSQHHVRVSGEENGSP
jgi:hypothetical protein